MRNYYFTSESVTEGHPDKVCDQISDGILDAILREDPMGRVACETSCTTGLVQVIGEVTTHCYVDVQKLVREIVLDIGYDNAAYGFDGATCGVITSIHEQSPDIALGVDNSAEVKAGEAEDQNGAWDQGMMFGYACNETPLFIPLTVALSHAILKELSKIRREESAMTYITPAGVRKSYLRPDSKSQVTVEYDSNNHPVRVNTIVVSTQHDDFIAPSEGKTQDEADMEMLEIIRKDVAEVLLPRLMKVLPQELHRLFDENIILHVNPTGKFVIGGPHGDTGLTGRKIIVDTYGGRGAHGGGAFSGKDPSKVDRSAAYAARHIAKNLVAAGVAEEALVQVAYAIGVAQPVSLYVNTRGTAKINMTDGEISKVVSGIFDMRPNAIENRLKLRAPIYLETATYGHIGRTPRKVTKTFHSRFQGERTMEVELFTWEKLDYVDTVRKAFGI